MAFKSSRIRLLPDGQNSFARFGLATAPQAANSAGENYAFHNYFNILRAPERLTQNISLRNS
jgi:hypothetical protein